MLKVYGIHGRTTAIIKIPFNHGKGSIECEFENGLIGQGMMNEPAKYSTNSKFVQNIIENSPLFGGLIQLVRSFEEPGDNDEAPAAPAEAVAAPAPAAAPSAADAAAQANAKRLAAARAAKEAKKASRNAVTPADGVEPAQEDEQGGKTQYQGGAATATATRDAGLEKGTDAPGQNVEITTREQAIEVLKANGALATDLISDEAILAFMKKKGISFPNLEF